MTPDQRELLLALRGLSRVFEKQGHQKKAAMTLAADTLSGLRKQAEGGFMDQVSGAAGKVGDWWNAQTPGMQYGLGAGAAGLIGGGLYDRLRPRESWEEDPSLSSTLGSALWGGGLGAAAGGLYGKYLSPEGSEIEASKALAVTPEQRAAYEAAQNASAEGRRRGIKVGGGYVDPAKAGLGLAAGGMLVGGVAPTVTGLLQKAVTGLGRTGPLAFLPYGIEAGRAALDPVGSAQAIADVGKGHLGASYTNLPSDMLAGASNPMAGMAIGAARQLGGTDAAKQVQTELRANPFKWADKVFNRYNPFAWRKR